MKKTISRRSLIAGTAGLSCGALLGPTSNGLAAESSAESAPSFRYCLNTSTIRGHKLPIDQQVELTAKAGYDGIEPWIRDIDAYREGGGSLSDLAKRISDLGLKVESAIGFASWIVADDQQRAKGLENMKRDMDTLRQIGGTRIAAPPAGATRGEALNLFAAAERYHDLLELGRQMEVTPQLELWGFSKNVSRLGELIFIVVESGHEDACMLPDVYHIYKGGSDFTGLQCINGKSMHALHVNDYPNMDRANIQDKDRVYPGDGVAPLKAIFGYLSSAGFSGTLSLELFNPEYWKQDAMVVAKTGLEKMKKSVNEAYS